MILNSLELLTENPTTLVVGGSDRNYITKAARYVFVISNDEKIGLNTYCRSHKIPYDKAKAITNANNLSEIKENILLELIRNEEMQYAI